MEREYFGDCTQRFQTLKESIADRIYWISGVLKAHILPELTDTTHATHSHSDDALSQSFPVSSLHHMVQSPFCSTFNRLSPVRVVLTPAQKQAKVKTKEHRVSI